MTDPAQDIASDLVKAYRDATYIIHGEDGDIWLRADQPSLELISLMKRYGAKSAAFITAFIPNSIFATAEANAHNHIALVKDINSLGLESIAGEGRDPLKIWPSEPSVLVLGISHQSAELLAGRYGQNAFLWIECADGLVSLNLRYPVRELYK